ncbi:MAG: hypothetical protein ACFHVJ_13210 [Aestuariibacter sp.]
MSKLDKDQVIADFTEAYKAANGKEPSIEAKSGWYSVDGGKNIRLAQLEEMTAELKGGKAKQAEEKPAAKKAAPKKAAEKKAEEPKKAEKKVEKKASAPKKAKAPAKKSSGFSVKQWWNEKLDTENPGSTLPR